MSQGMDKNLSTNSVYAASGVDIAAADTAKRLMRDTVRATQGSNVLAGKGAFSGILDASSVQTKKHPGLVASTDCVGTKTLVAPRGGRFDTTGHEPVHHS